MWVWICITEIIIIITIILLLAGWDTALQTSSSLLLLHYYYYLYETLHYKNPPHYYCHVTNIWVRHWTNEILIITIQRDHAVFNIYSYTGKPVMSNYLSYLLHLTCSSIYNIVHPNVVSVVGCTSCYSQICDGSGSGTSTHVHLSY